MFFFIFLNDLKLTLYIQNIKVESLKDLAKILREERKARCITKLQLLTEYGLNFNLINKIETGKNIEKETLKKYLVFLPPLKISIQRKKIKTHVLLMIDLTNFKPIK